MRIICGASKHQSSSPLALLPFELLASHPLHDEPSSHAKQAYKSLTHLKRPVFGLLKLFRSFFSVLRVSSQYEDHYQDFAHFVVIAESNGPSINLGVPLLMRYPDFLSKYSLLPKKKVGRGSSGTIHLATSKTDPTRLYAVKIFNKCRSKSVEAEYISHLSSEFMIGASLHHKNIVETYELVKIGHSWLEIMEYCNGGDLFHSISKNQLSQRLVDYFFLELLSGIQYLHSLGIAHCDLKPENILISKDNHVKIADFGASCCFSKFNGPPFLKEGEDAYCQGICGSLPYIAPEVLSLEPYDPAPVDIWSLGIIYLVMAFHRIPWNEASIEKDKKYRRYLIQRIKFDPISRLPAPIGKIICRMLEPDPKLRITINELVNNPYIQHLAD